MYGNKVSHRQRPNTYSLFNGVRKSINKEHTEKKARRKKYRNTEYSSKSWQLNRNVALLFGSETKCQLKVNNFSFVKQKATKQKQCCSKYASIIYIFANLISS